MFEKNSLNSQKGNRGKKFGQDSIFSNGCTTSSVRYASIFAAYTLKVKAAYNKLLSGIPPTVKDTNQFAQKHNELLKFVLLVYSKRVSSLVIFVGDNASESQEFSNLVGPSGIDGYIQGFS